MPLLILVGLRTYLHKGKGLASLEVLLRIMRKHGYWLQSVEITRCHDRTMGSIRISNANLDMSCCGWADKTSDFYTRGPKVTSQLGSSTCLYVTSIRIIIYIVVCLAERREWARPAGQTNNVNAFLVPGNRMWTIKLLRFKNPISIVNKIAGYDISRQNLTWYDILTNKTYKW